MDPSELAFASVLILLLLGLGGYYAWRQVQLLRRLRSSLETLQDQTFLRTQAIRRLICSGLIIVFACLLCGSYFLENLLPNDKATAPDKSALFLFSSYWIGIFLLFLTILCLAGIDVLATRRYTLRQLRLLHDQHDSLFAQHAARIRGQRNGQR